MAKKTSKKALKSTKNTPKSHEKTKKPRRSAKETKKIDKSRDKILAILGDVIKEDELEKHEMRVGRPTKYLPKVHPQALELLMSDGLSFEASCAQLGIHETTGQAWDKKHKEFSMSKKRGEILSRLWWERAGKKGMFWGKDFNATIWVFAMKNRFDYHDNKNLNLGGQKGNPVNANGPLGAILDELESMDDDALDHEFERIAGRLGKK